MRSDLSADAVGIARRALAEDGAIDLTSELSCPPGMKGSADLWMVESGVLAGTEFADAVARETSLELSWSCRDGAEIGAGQLIASLEGDLRSLLRAERPLLNLLQRACGIATLTHTYVRLLDGTACKVLHTRKTAPGLRALDVSSVLAGGGQRHRLGLDRCLMIKDNHWKVLERSAVTLADVIRGAMARGSESCYVEVETKEQISMAVESGAGRLLIDNQDPKTFGDWAKFARSLKPDIEVEATGGISLDTVRSYAQAGADYVSIGALTHSPPAMDLKLEIRSATG